MKITRWTLALLMLMVSPALWAQQQVEMADTLRSEGKIYVVVTIIATIFIGIAAYLFMIDRKVTRLEKKIPEKKD